MKPRWFSGRPDVSDAGGGAAMVDSDGSRTLYLHVWVLSKPEPAGQLPYEGKQQLASTKSHLLTGALHLFSRILKTFLNAS